MRENQHRIDFLSLLPSNHRPAQLTGDIYTRLHPTVAKAIDEMQPQKNSVAVAKTLAHHKIRETLYQSTKSPECSVRYGGCLFHPNGECYKLKYDPDKLSFKFVGIPCVDASAANRDACGDAGRSYVPATICYADAKLTQPVACYIECTLRYGVQEMQTALGDTHCVHAMTWR